jgi:formylglycine-generating enzyme required for sulfatase activity
MRVKGYLAGWIALGMGFGGLAVGGELDPKVRELMKKYEREAAEEAAKQAPKPQPKPRAPVKPPPQPKPKVAKPQPKPAPVELPAEVVSESASIAPPMMVRIPAGCFLMGSPLTETGRKSDERQHRVCVEAFEIGQREVTVEEFGRFFVETGYRTDAERDMGGPEGCFIAYRDGDEWKYGYRAGYSWKNPNFQQSDDHPVVCVSWNDAVAYTQWLSRETGRTYRLPSEAEWEYAARAGTTTARYWGDDPNRACWYANVADQTAGQTFSGWTIHDCTDSYVYTAPVGSFQPNAWRLYDMLGNVWEWTCSAYAKEYDGSEIKCTTKDTIGPLAVRGGTWSTLPARVRSAYRARDDPADRNFSRGFRLARSL